MNYDDLFELIKLSLWNAGSPKVDLAVFDEMKAHAIAALPATVLPSLIIDPELLQSWKKILLQQIAYFAQYKYVQANLPITVPYVILKGTTASQYYPSPELRTLGDIDLMTKPEDCAYACEQMLENGWTEVTSSDDQERGRHRSFKKHGIIVEIHVFFASMNDVNKARFLDDMIVSNIDSTHILPDMINGLVLIDHINQHMETGIGLRQIIDWMMFTDKCLPDGKWLEFERLVEKTGLKKLALVTTRMCEIYLGLSPHQWCANVSEKLCSDYLMYVMDSGNFGKKRVGSDPINMIRIAKLKHPIRMIIELQRMGRSNWCLADHFLFRSFAWVWQGIQLIKGTPKSYLAIKTASRNNALLKSLGVKRSADGLVTYENGEYVKKR